MALILQQPIEESPQQYCDLSKRDTGQTVVLQLAFKKKKNILHREDRTSSAFVRPRLDLRYM